MTDNYSRKRYVEDARKKHLNKLMARRTFLTTVAAVAAMTLFAKCTNSETESTSNDSLEIINCGDENEMSRQIAKVTVSVQPEEAIDDIIERYYSNIPRDIALDSIMLANDLGGNVELTEGQTLELYITQFERFESENPVDTRDIATDYGCDESLIAAVNNVRQGEELSGEIRLPRQAAIDEGLTPVIVQPYNSADPSPHSTYWGIAREHSAEVANVMAFNAMDARDLNPGQIVLVPDATPAQISPIANSEFANRQERIRDFAKNYGELAEMVEKKYKIPVDLTLAQAILESDYGCSELATEAFNFFGIKADDNWRGETYIKTTVEYEDGVIQEVSGVAFRKYADAEAGFRGYGEKVHEGYYNDAFGYDNPHEFLERMVDDNGPMWATDPEYFAKVTGLIDEVGYVLHPETFPPQLPETLEQLDTSVRERIGGVELTTGGYHEFVRSIDDSVKSYAESHENFDGSTIEDDGTKLFVWHYTAGYYNGANLGFPTGIEVPDSEAPDRDHDAFPRHLVSSMCNAGKGTGIQYFIDRNGKTWLLTNNKTWHCFTPSSISEGVEIESLTQENIKTEQYTAAAYLAAHRIIEYGLLDKGYPLDDVLSGHNTLKESQLVQDYCGTGFEVNQDFPSEPTILLREKVRELLNQLGYEC